MRIMLDAGHGGKDPGASGNGLVEAILTGQITDVIERQLSGYDVEVLKTSRGTLSERTREANDANVNCFLSIHVNASPGGTGYESHVHPTAPQGEKNIAKAIHTTIAAFYAQKGFPDRGLKESNFAVLRETKMPAVLLENLFIDNQVDAEFLKNNLPAIGNEIAYAIVVALDLKPKPVDKCETCSKYLKVFAELQIAKQTLKQVAGIAGPWVTK